MAGGWVQLITSQDSPNWTQHLSTTDPDVFRFISSFAKGNGYYLTGGYDVYRSTDGASWETIGIPTTFYELIFNGSEFVGLGYSGTYRSVDGTSWLHVSARGFPRHSNACFADNKIVVVGPGNSMVVGNPEGTQWTEISLPTHKDLRGIKYINGRWIVVGGDYDQGGIVMTSSDAINWTITYDGRGPFFDLAFGNGWYCATGGGGSVHWSQDLIDWTTINAITTNQLNDIIFDGERFVATRHSGAVLATTPPLPQINAPEHRLPDKIVRTRGGVDIPLDGTFTGAPSPEINWYKGGILLEGNDPDYSIDAQNNLTINQVDSSSSGIYYCTAENLAGSATGPKTALQVNPSGTTYNEWLAANPDNDLVDFTIASPPIMNFSEENNTFELTLRDIASNFILEIEHSYNLSDWFPYSAGLVTSAFQEDSNRLVFEIQDRERTPSQFIRARVSETSE